MRIKSLHQRRSPHILENSIQIDIKLNERKECLRHIQKNTKVGVFTAPFPIEDAPTDAKKLNPTVAFKVKELDADNKWDLHDWNFANGSMQTDGINFNSSFAAIVLTDSIHTCLAFGARIPI